MPWIVRVYFSIGTYDDSVVLEADTLPNMRTLIDKELAQRGATYTGLDTLQEGNASE